MPVIQLECQLKESGDNPESWISFCDQCTQLIRKGRELDEEIQKIERRLRSIKKQILGQIRACEGKTQQMNGENCFEKKIRSFVKNYEYYGLREKDIKNDTHGFEEGDELAKYLDSQGNHCAAAILLVGKPCDQDEDEIKIEQESPPMSPAADDSTSDQFMDEDDPSFDPGENEGKPVMANCSCSVCCRKFKTERGLNRHMKMVHKQRLRITCPVCGMAFGVKQSLHRHLLGKHKDDPITRKLEKETGLFFRKCSVVGCCFQFMKQEDGDRHMEKIHSAGGGGDQYKCKYCGRGFWDKWKCRRHEKIHEEKGKVRQVTWNTAGMGARVTTTTTKIPKQPSNFKCDHCGKGFRWAKNWSQHLWDKHEKRDIMCPGLECGKIFKDDLAQLQKHWRSCVQKKMDGVTEKHLCSFCGKEFRKPSGLRTHLKSHTEGSPSKTDGKKKKSNGGEKADKRISSTIKQAEGQFICGTCGKGYISKTSLWQHNRKIHRIGIAGLPVRAKRRNGERALASSIAKPGSSTKVLCNICGKEYSSSENLKTHVKFVHDKEFSLSCHVCGLGAVSRDRLNKHLLSRHGDDPVARQLEEEEGLKLRTCPVVGCVAKFLKEGALDKHVERFHGGGGGDGSGEKKEPRFKCKYCGRGYWLGNKLKRHELMHEGKGREDWKCGLCGKGFGTKEYLRYHELFTHKLSKKFQKSGEEKS